MSLFGRLVGANHVEDAAVGVLRKWFVTYLYEVERQSGIEAGTIAEPRGVRVSGGVEKMPEDQTPTLIVASPGISDDAPVTNGARQYQARFILDLAGVVSAKGGLESGGSPRALRLARLYALAMRGCLGQQADDDGILYRRDWVAEDYDVLDSIDDRTICVAKVRFEVEVPDVLTLDAGPIGPYGPPPETDPLPISPEWPIATDAEIEVVKVPIDSEVEQ
jgi:hypothetical protein